MSSSARIHITTTPGELVLGKQKDKFILSVAVFWIILLGAIGVAIYAFVSGSYLLLAIPAVFFGFVVYTTVIARKDAAFVPTPELVVRQMLEMAELKPGETLYDLGSGDGRVVRTAARDFGAKAIGIELDRGLTSNSTRQIKTENLEEKARIMEGNFFETDLSAADVVTLYLRQDTNDRLSAKFKKELRPGTRVVSYTFVMTGWNPTKVENGRSAHSRVYLYTM